MSLENESPNLGGQPSGPPRIPKIEGSGEMDSLPVGIIIGIVIFVIIVLIALVAVIIMTLRKIHSLKPGDQESPVLSSAVPETDRDRSDYDLPRPLNSPVFPSPLSPSYTGSNPSSPKPFQGSGQDYPTYRTDNNSGLGRNHSPKPDPGIFLSEAIPSRESRDPVYNVLPSPRPVPYQHHTHVTRPASPREPDYDAIPSPRPVPHQHHTHITRPASPRDPDYDAIPSPRPVPRQNCPDIRRPASPRDPDYDAIPLPRPVPQDSDYYHPSAKVLAGHNHSEPSRPKDPDYDILPRPRPVTDLNHSGPSTSKRREDPDYDTLPNPRPLTGHDHPDPSRSAKPKDPDYDKLPSPRRVTIFDNLNPEEYGADSCLPSPRPAVAARPNLSESHSNSQSNFKSRFVSDRKYSSQKATANMSNEGYDDSNDDPMNVNNRRPICRPPAPVRYEQRDESVYEAIYTNHR